MIKLLSMLLLYNIPKSKGIIFVLPICDIKKYVGM